MLIIGLLLVFYLLDLKAVQPSTRVIEFRGCTVEDKEPTPATRALPWRGRFSIAWLVAPNWRAEV
jgi:hypothetical protein